MVFEYEHTGALKQIIPTNITNYNMDNKSQINNISIIFFTKKIIVELDLPLWEQPPPINLR